MSHQGPTSTGLLSDKTGSGWGRTKARSPWRLFRRYSGHGRSLCGWQGGKEAYHGRRRRRRIAQRWRGGVRKRYRRWSASWKWRGARSIVASHEWTADQKVFWSKSKRINRREARKRFFRTKQFPGNAKRSVSTSIPLITWQQWSTSDQFHYQIWSVDKVVSAWSLSVPNHMISWLVYDQPSTVTKSDHSTSWSLDDPFHYKSDHFTACQCMISVFKKSAGMSQAGSESYQAWSSLDARTDEVWSQWLHSWSLCMQLN